VILLRGSVLVQLAARASDVAMRSSQFAQRSDAPIEHRHGAAEYKSQRSKRSTRSPSSRPRRRAIVPIGLAFIPHALQPSDIARFSSDTAKRSS
jgi:hypothetical protein